ncbi:MAG TPA: type II secretion system F family protein, partial [Chthonomonadales bacterium]|nr:type II secretion system F family protein [Chthonomonadales bacterium]
REKVKAAFVYPTIVLIASVGVVFFMLVFIVPVFAKVYDQFHAKLPAVTLSLIVLSNIILHYWWMVGALGVGAVMGVKKYLRTPAGRRLYDKMKLKAPLLGKLNRKIAIARFAETFAGASKAGVPIIRALAISAATSGNVIIIDAVMKGAGLVQEGASLAGPLEQTGEFPPMVTRMVAAGEHSGNLDEMLSELTRFYSRDIEYTVDRLTKIMEPAMTVCVGGIVLFVLLALYMPIFNMTQVLHAK